MIESSLQVKDRLLSHLLDKLSHDCLYPTPLFFQQSTVHVELYLSPKFDISTPALSASSMKKTLEKLSGESFVEVRGKEAWSVVKVEEWVRKKYVERLVVMGEVTKGAAVVFIFFSPKIFKY